MATATDLISNVYDMLSQTLATGTNQGTYLQMAWPGISLSPEDFKLKNALNAGYNTIVADETFSHLSNIAPVTNELKFENSGMEIDDLYEILITGAIPSEGNSADLESNPFYKRFSDAQFEFLNLRRGSVEDPNLFYRPSKATPSNWYTESSANFWPELNLSSSNVKPPDADSPFIKNGGKALIEQGILKAKNPAFLVDTYKEKLSQLILSKEENIKRSNPFFKTKSIIKPLENNKQVVIRDSQLGSRPRLTVNDNLFESRFRNMSSSIEFKKKIAPSPLLSGSNLNSLVASSGFNVGKNELTFNKVYPFNKRVLLNDLFDKQFVNVPVSPATNSFNISFKYCQVNINRPWLNLALLSQPNWYILGEKSGTFSPGNFSNPQSMFGMLPTSFIAIRDLKISANWSASDISNLRNSVSFGPFSIRGNSFNQNTIEVGGLQIIAWVSRLMPVLAPLNDPSI